MPAVAVTGCSMHSAKTLIIQQVQIVAENIDSGLVERSILRE
jgi:hypothetical protein